MVNYRGYKREIFFWCLFEEGKFYFMLFKCVIYLWRAIDILEKYNLFFLFVFCGRVMILMRI